MGRHPSLLAGAIIMLVGISLAEKLGRRNRFLKNSTLIFSVGQYIVRIDYRPILLRSNKRCLYSDSFPGRVSNMVFQKPLL